MPQGGPSADPRGPKPRFIPSIPTAPGFHLIGGRATCGWAPTAQGRAASASWAHAFPGIHAQMPEDGMYRPDRRRVLADTASSCADLHSHQPFAGARMSTRSSMLRAIRRAHLGQHQLVLRVLNDGRGPARFTRLRVAFLARLLLGSLSLSLACGGTSGKRGVSPLAAPASSLFISLYLCRHSKS